MVTAEGGTLLAGRYRLEERIAFGGMGQVWRATDELLVRPVAVKVLRPEYASDERFRRRLRAEARAAARLSHPGIAAVYDYGEETDEAGDCTAYLVMQLVDGEPLNLWLAREGRLPPSTVLDVIAQTADALAAAHLQGVVHRDVKPANLMRRHDGSMVITDFGISRAADVTSVTETGATVGTPHYMAPEHIEGRDVEPAADLYSLGVVAYECLAGARPFDGDHSMAVAYAHLQREPAALPADVPKPVARLVARLLEKDPERRPVSAAAVAAEAEAAGGGTQASLAAQEERPARNRRRALALAAAGAVVVIVAPGGWLLASARGTRVVSVLGMSWDGARAALARAGLRPVERVADVAGAPAGTVTAENPHARSRVGTGSAVTLTVASGWETLDAATFVGQPYASAAAELTRMGLHPVRYVVASERPPGSVTRVHPGGRVRVGSEVVVDVASGRTGLSTSASATSGSNRYTPAPSGAAAPSSSTTTSSSSSTTTTRPSTTTTAPTTTTTAPTTTTTA